MWTCKKCNREFLKTNQSHSCVVYPIDNHFQGKGEKSKALFSALTKSIEDNIGKLKIEALPCCIHLVSHYTFSGVWILKDKIRLDFRVGYEIKSKRFVKVEKLSTNRTLYFVEIAKEDDIDSELLGWLKDSYNLKGN